MKRFAILIFSLFVLLPSVFAQKKKDLGPVHDPLAKKVLDQVSNRYKQFKTIKLDFEYEVYDYRDTSKNKLKKQLRGWLIAKGQNQYKLSFDNLLVICDGIRIYTINKKDKEVTISLYDPNSSNILTPQKLLFIYNHGFKYSYRGYARFNTKDEENGKIVPKLRTMDIVDLYPENPKKAEYSIIRIWVDKTTHQIISIKYQARNGISYVVDIVKEQPNIKLPADEFTFDPKKLPKSYQITDLTKDD